MASGKSDDRNGSELEGTIYDQTPQVHKGTHVNRHKTRQINHTKKDDPEQHSTTVISSTDIGTGGTAAEPTHKSGPRAACCGETQKNPKDWVEQASQDRGEAEAAASVAHSTFRGEPDRVVEITDVLLHGTAHQQ